MGERRTWHPEGSYSEGERVTHGGVAWEAKMEIPRGFRPDDPRNFRFWKRALVIKPLNVVRSGEQRQRSGVGYQTRAMGLDRK